MYKPNIEGMQYNEEVGIFHSSNFASDVHDQPQRLFLLGGTHGQEFAGPMAIMQLLQEEWRWPNVDMVAIIQDPIGYKEEGYGFVGVDEHQSMWPPLWRHPKNDEIYWFYVDENSAWGNNVAVPPRHQFMRNAMDFLDPTFVLSLHETVSEETRRHLFWAGAGLLLIETYPMSLHEYNGAIDPIGPPLSDPIGWSGRVLKDWLRGVWKGMRYQEASKALARNPHYKQVTKIAEKYTADGGRVAGTPWMRYLEHVGMPTIGPGRLIHGPMMIQSEWKTVTDYATGWYGCPGVTTETFQPAELGLRGLDERVDQQYRYIIATLDVLNEVPNESN